MINKTKFKTSALCNVKIEDT